MYIQTWLKYLPVIRILLKRATDGAQTFQLNLSDFEKTGTPRKTGFKFTIRFANGRADNLSALPPIAKDFASVLVQDATINELFKQHVYQVSMSSKFQLDIQCIVKAVQETEVPVATEEEA
jgi:hypothetical protein